jgi:Glucose / Sorbosone dehydrogenase
MLLANLGGVIRAAGTVVAISLALLATSSAQALTLEPVGGGFDQPTYLTSDPGDAGRLFVAEREGTIQLVEDGVVSEFADLSSKVGCPCSGERGLMSIALDPGFAANGRLYAFYGSQLDGQIHVDELVSTDPGHDSADISTLKPLLAIPHPGQVSHYGGQLQFGPDGFLYVSTGDGGGANDPLDNAQNPGSQLGKILRLDPDAPGSEEIWSLGLRNPFRFSFDRLSGDMVIGDVGQSEREEIDFAPSPFPGVVGGQGANYGWDCREGFLPGFGPPDPQCATPPAAGFVDPVFDYPHLPDPDLGGDNRCSITGGYVARDAALGALFGTYVYGDYCSGAIRALRLPASASGTASGDCSLGLKVDSPVSFGEDSAGRLYVVEQGGGVYRFAGLPAANCPAPLPQPGSSPIQARSPLAPTFVGIQPQRRRVERGKAALLTVWVSPCKDRRGDSVALRRNGRPFGTRYLSRACTARFTPRIRRGTTFVAFTHEQSGYLPGESRRLKIRLAPRRRR